MNDKIHQYAVESKEEILDLLRALCAIPAPSGKEEKRAEFCKKWLEGVGAEGVYIDDALNVVFPYQCAKSDRITVVVAHTDTVFPDLEPLPYSEDETYIRCPGVGDDTANLAALMMMAKFFIREKISFPGGVLFVCNSCEEGLGNLKGTREIFRVFEGRIRQFLSLDSGLTGFATRCVGSHRYQVEVATEGGHSYGAFGKKSAIDALAGMIREIYSISVPVKEGTKTSYNVGIIEGGTSVNTIAQSASMLCEYRSSDLDCLNEMKAKFEDIFARANEEEEVSVKITLVGDRPCQGDVDPKELERMISSCTAVYERVLGKTPVYGTSSTDCNIPLSLGIPALCIGCRAGRGVHTREEWVEKASLPIGLEAGLGALLSLA